METKGHLRPNLFDIYSNLFDIYSCIIILHKNIAIPTQKIYKQLKSNED